MKKKGMQHHLDGLIALLLFGIFAVCIVAVLLTGANAYRRLTQRDQAAYNRRVCAQYLATRVRQADRAGGVSVEPFGEPEALVLAEDETYSTRVYWYNGYLMELYAETAGNFQPMDGTPVMEAGSLEMDFSGGLLTLEISTPAGETDTLRLDLRSGREAAA